MYRSRFFYAVDDGHMLLYYRMSGSIVAMSAEQDAEQHGLDGWGYVEIPEEDMHVEEGFARQEDEHGNPVAPVARFDFNTQDIVFDYIPIAPPVDEKADMQAALDLLGVTPLED